MEPARWGKRSGSMSNSIGSLSDQAPGWVRRLAHSRVGVGVLSMGESTVLPIPLEVVIVPLMVAYHRKALSIALSALAGCLIGASLFYCLGALLYEPLVVPVLNALGLLQNMRDALDNMSNADSFWAIFLVSLGPVPMQLATLAAGVSKVSFPVFFLAILASRGIRYLGLAVICRLAGRQIMEVEMPRHLVTIATAILMAASWAALYFLI